MVNRWLFRVEPLFKLCNAKLPQCRACLAQRFGKKIAMIISKKNQLQIEISQSNDNIYA
jgi:hypothetical protein